MDWGVYLRHGWVLRKSFTVEEYTKIKQERHMSEGSNGLENEDGS